jgi:NitT/TauT family transport system permease protein
MLRLTPRWGWRAAPILAVLLAWQAASTVATPALLPSPRAVIVVLIDETLHGPLLHHLGATLLRVAVCFVLAMTVGIAAGIAMGASQRINRWADPWLQLFLNVPAMVVAILAYVWLGLGEPAAIAAVTLSKLPNVVVIIRQGTRQRDRDLSEMAKAYRMSRRTVLFHLLLPELAPYVLAAARSGLSLVWKIVLLVELLGRSSGIGFQLHVFFQLLDITRILAYAISFMLVIHLVEVSVLAWGDRRVERWQR